METEKTVEEILALNGIDSRCERQNRLLGLKTRLEDWLSALDARGKGLSLREMGLIVEEIEKKLESIKTQDQG